MNHYVHHFSKYVGRLSKTYSEPEKQQQIEKTLADSIIVALAAANTLNLDLRDELEEEHDIDSTGAIAIAEELNQGNGPEKREGVQNWLFEQLATPTGRMADAMESLDHMEPMNTRQILEEETANIFTILLTASNEIEIDLISLLDNRWHEIEEKSIL